MKNLWHTCHNFIPIFNFTICPEALGSYQFWFLLQYLRRNICRCSPHILCNFMRSTRKTTNSQIVLMTLFFMPLLTMQRRSCWWNTFYLFDTLKAYLDKSHMLLSTSEMLNFRVSETVLKNSHSIKLWKVDEWPIKIYTVYGNGKVIAFFQFRFDYCPVI